MDNLLCFSMYKQANAHIHTNLLFVLLAIGWCCDVFPSINCNSPIISRTFLKPKPDSLLSTCCVKKIPKLFFTWCVFFSLPACAGSHIHYVHSSPSLMASCPVWIIKQAVMPGRACHSTAALSRLPFFWLEQHVIPCHHQAEAPD